MMPWRKTLCMRLSADLRAVVLRLGDAQAAQLEEIRVYTGRAAQLIIDGRRVQTDCVADMDELLCALSGQALYSSEGQLAQGYISLPGGHRAGVCGAMRLEQGVWRMGSISSVCIRICRQVPGASAGVRAHLLDEKGKPRCVLLLGAPGCGKTTVLRDAALYLSEGCHLHVAVADEREELFPDRKGLRLDVLGGMDKAQAMALLLRAMAPQVIVTDEIGDSADAQALMDAARCGTGVLATAHASDIFKAAARPVLGALMRSAAFERYILLGRRGSVQAVYDERLNEIGQGGSRCGIQP